MRTLVSVATIAMLACSPALPPLPLDDEFTICEVDDECTYVSFACCPCTGTGRFVNVASVDEVMRAYGESCGENIDCPDVECDVEISPMCNDGTCTDTP